MGDVTYETLEEKLEKAVVTLIEMAGELTWNKISKTCYYIISVEEHSDKNFAEQNAIRSSVNDKKRPKPLAAIMPDLRELYVDMYDINLYVYRALRTSTIIEISYFPRSLLDHDYRKTVDQNPPMLHCKVKIPSYAHSISPNRDSKKKFDINWDRNSLYHRWMMFWWRLKFKLRIGKI